MEELDKTRESQHAALQSELKKEMQLLQKRILMDTVSLNVKVYQWEMYMVSTVHGLDLSSLSHGEIVHSLDPMLHAVALLIEEATS